jgi:glucose/arabinose dehydrogenase
MERLCAFAAAILLVLFAPAAAAATWTFVANENASFTVSGTQTARYGVEPRWVQKTVSGNVPCTNAYFGSDPAFGVVKGCYVSSDAPAATWVVVANEGQAFTLTGSQTIRYGVDTRWITKVLSGTVPCTNGFFGGDPAYGVVKRCERQSGSSPNQPPVATIASPASGTTFRAGQTFTFSGSATDPEDGTEPASRLTWWADLHHDTHTHPFVLPTTGASGTATIPVRGETSDNIWYRFHLRATDSQGATHEVTRDILPQKSQFTLATVPTGLQLTLDGQPVTAPRTTTGVVGIERDIAAADQNFNGRKYRFTSWSDGGAAAHTISTPAANTTYTATFTDIGPVINQPPSVALSAPASGTRGTPMTLNATASDSDGTIARVEFFDGGSKIGEDTTSPYSLSWTPTTAGTHTLTARATDSDGAMTTSSAQSVAVSDPAGDTTPPSVSITAPAHLTQNLTGTIGITANASDNVGVQSVEFQVDGVAVGAADTTAPYGVAFDTNTLASGQHMIRARARDTAGNLSTWATAVVTFGGSRNLPQGFTRVDTWVGGIATGTAMAQAPDGRIFVAEQGGRLRVVKNGSLLATPFVTLAVDGNGERGLIGVALDPGFASNHFVYVHYTTPQNGAHNRISRFTANGDVAAGGETVLVDLPALDSATNHNGGALHFGMDGKLYVGVGENATPSRSQDLNDPKGKLLRFNADGTIPSDNPFFASRTGLARAIWAYGLRNPFTFAVQPGTGRIHVNDVGQDSWEEINVGAPGANYGWPGSEGLSNVTAGITGPLFTYRHGPVNPAGSGPGGFFIGLCIAGGAFYPGTGPFPAQYRGNYFFADYVSGFVGLLDLANGNAAYAFASGLSSPVDVMVGADGALYVLTRSSIARITAP